jgi:DNA-binding GntR family transcriptional regulator
MTVNRSGYTSVYSPEAIGMTTTVFEHESSQKVTRTPKSKKRKPTSLVNKIYESLVGEIITGVVPPGCYLSESRLADRFRASRTPVREVLIHLHKEGFVQKGPSKGFVVSQLSLESIRELFFLRLLLEPAAAKLASRNSSVEPGCEELEQVHTRMKQEMEQKINFYDILELSNLDHRFHTFVGQASGNKRLGNFIADIMNQFRRVHCGCYQHRTWDSETLEEHKSILDAIRGQDPSAAEQRMLHHLRKSIGRAKVLFAEMLGDHELL